MQPSGEAVTTVRDWVLLLWQTDQDEYAKSVQVEEGAGVNVAWMVWF